MGWCILASFSILPGWVKAEKPRYIEFKSGSRMDVISAAVEGDFLVVRTEHGLVKFPKTSLSSEFLRQYFAETKATPAPARTAHPGKIAAQQTPDTYKVTSVKPNPEQSDRLSQGSAPNKEKRFIADKVNFEIGSTMPGDDKVKIQALLPRDPRRQVPESASNIVFYAPYIGYFDMLQRFDSQDTRFLWELCEVHGLTVFTAEFKTRVEDVDDRKKCYYYPESGSFKVIFEARKELIRTYGLAEKRMFVIGNSGGSSMAQRLGLLYPDTVAAIAMVGGGRFDAVDRRVDVPWLILNTRGDHRARQNWQLAEELRARNMNALYAETEPLIKSKEDFARRNDDNFHHSPSNLALELMKEFIVSAAKPNQGANPILAEQWPLSAPTSEPFKITKVFAEVLNDKPFENRIFFPSPKFADLWMTVPYRTLPLQYPDDEEGKHVLVKAKVRYPTPMSSPKGIIVLGCPSYTPETEALDYMDYLALQGYVSIWCPLSDSEPTMQLESRALVDTALKILPEKSLPVYLLGIRSGSRHLLLASTAFEDSRIRSIAAIDAELDWPLPEFSPMAALKKLSVPTIVLVSSANGSDTAAMEARYFKLGLKNKRITLLDAAVDRASALPEFNALETALSLCR